KEVAGFVGTIEGVIATWVALLGQIPPGIVHPLTVGPVRIGKLYRAICLIEQKAEDIASFIGYLTQIPALVCVRNSSLKKALSKWTEETEPPDK
ncbi:hypothetical protein, partial [Porphyromonas gulae]